MKIGLIGDVSLRPALQAAGHALLELAVHADADLAGRVQAGTQAAQQLRGAGLDALFDRDGAGLLLVQQGGEARVSLLHEALSVPLVSEFTRPLPVALAALTPEALWQCLASRRWFKLVADAPHAEELRRLGLPGVVELPPGAAEASGAERDALSLPRGVAYQGDVRDEPFLPGRAHLGSALRVALLARAGLCGGGGARFADACGLELTPDSPLERRSDYYAARRLHIAMRDVDGRVHALRVLSSELPRRLLVSGEGWERYGISASHEARPALINLAFPPPDAEAGLEPAALAAALSGGMLLCEDATRVGQWLERGRECETFGSAPELIEKCRHYLEHADEALTIGAAGRERCLREYSHRARLGRLAAAVAELRGLDAPAAPGAPGNVGLGAGRPAATRF